MACRAGAIRQTFPSTIDRAGRCACEMQTNFRSARSLSWRRAGGRGRNLALTAVVLFRSGWSTARTTSTPCAASAGVEWTPVVLLGVPVPCIERTLVYCLKQDERSVCPPLVRRRRPHPKYENYYRPLSSVPPPLSRRRSFLAPQICEIVPAAETVPQNPKPLIFEDEDA